MEFKYINNCVNPLEDRVVCEGMACILFVKQSTTANIALNPLLSGSSPIMSTEMTFQGPSGISFGLRGAALFCRCALTFWHVSHPVTYLITSVRILGHQNVREINSLVLSCPGCPAVASS